ncbi:MAG: glutamine-hydrolyzing carbamoyl-phosphate synthase small subunit [Candidatus Levybacteria bacterium]|nr:glutamine-hydrolyzing carbamoyl-phosphate synthase small subunit [Candidatus Levybacteria bacterium]
MVYAKLVLEDGSEYSGKSFGAEKSSAGEAVFTTGMVGYPESLTDASYGGQLLIFTYPLIGSYGVADQKYWESASIKANGLIVSSYIDTPSHFQSNQTLGEWLKKEEIPGIEIPDTRELTIKLREKGTMLGKIVINDQDQPWYDPNVDDLLSRVSTKKVFSEGSGDKTIILIDCGVKKNIATCLVERNARVITVPWDYDIFSLQEKFDGVVISNGPGDPKMAGKTIETIKKVLEKKIPILGICLGHQLLALAAGGDTTKLKYGHRSQNQPCTMHGSKRCFITTQNHGFEVSKIPQDFTPWFTNANDGSNEGIIHKTLPFMSTQFHPEARPGPEDTQWIFDEFLSRIT